MEELKTYCIDSDILIDYLRGFEEARRFLIRASRETILLISIVSVVEIYAGKDTRDIEKKRLIDEFFGNFQIIDLSFPVAKRAGELRRDLQKPFADMIIAASSLESNAILVTKNNKHFQGINRLKVLRPY